MSISVFTYGTLQIPAVMEAVTGRKFKSENASLDGYERFIVKRQVFPGITAAIDKRVDGRIYFDLDMVAINFLDAFEDVLYVRKQLSAWCNNRKIQAQVYIVDDKFHNLLSDKPWEIEVFQQKHLRAYLDSCKKFHSEFKQTL